MDDEPIAGDARGWVWTPGFYAGEVTAQLIDEAGRTVAEYLLDVAPDDRKLGRDRFRELLSEVLEEDPSLIVGDEPATALTGRDAMVDDSLAALMSFARIRVYGPQFLQAVDEAAKQPRTTVRRVRTFAPAHRVKRVDLATARSLARSSGLAMTFAGQAELASVEASGFERLIDVPLHEPNLDCAANRCIVAVMDSVRARIRSIKSALAARAEREEISATRTSFRSRWPHRAAVLDRIDAALTRRLRQEPWRSVRRPEVTAAGLNAVAADPLYARAYQQGWKALRTGIGGDAAKERMWMSPTWELFERWCFLRVQKGLRRGGSGAGVAANSATVACCESHRRMERRRDWRDVGGPSSAELPQLGPACPSRLSFRLAATIPGHRRHLESRRGTGICCI